MRIVNIILTKGMVHGISTIKKYFKWSRKGFHRCNHHKYKISAVIIVNGKPISYGWNDIDKTHPSMGLKRQHAEISAINRCKHKFDLNNAVIVVYGENRFGERILAKPCECCQEHIESFGFKKVVYSTPKGYGQMSF